MCNVLLWSPPGHQTTTYHRTNRGHDLSETYCNYDALLLIKASINRHPDINCEQQPATMLLGNHLPLTPRLHRDSTSGPTARKSTLETSSESFHTHWGGNSQLPHSRQTSAPHWPALSGPSPLTHARPQQPPVQQLQVWNVFWHKTIGC